MDRGKALCRDYHIDFWYPPFADERDCKESDYYDIAKAVCFMCPLLDECEEEGKDEESGMWGGWTPRERNKGARKASTKSYTPDHLAVLPEPNTRNPLNMKYVKDDLREVSVRLRKTARSLT